MSSTLSSYSKSRQISGFALTMLALLAVALAAFYRLPDLGLRPMHTDEAILATKFVDMCKTGHFDYDPTDYHGPGLHMVTYLYGLAAGWHNVETLSDADLRRVVAVTGILLVLLTLLLSDAIGRLATGLAMLMVAVSPMEVFYSRYFIMEIPYVLFLTLFMVGCWRYAKSESVIWVLVAGLALGLLHATKETFVINMGAMFCGWIAAQFLSEGFTDRNRSLFLSLGRDRHFVRWPWLWIAIVGAVVSVTLYSGFYRHWDDVVESLTTYGNYLKRSGGAGHAKPWHYYLGILLYTKDYYVWTEAMIVCLAGVGVMHAFTGRFQREEERKAFLVFLSVYAMVALFVYSLIPYKTPWTLLSVQYALILLAGAGAQRMFEMFRGPVWKAICVTGMVVGLWHLCDQSMNSIHDPHQLTDGKSLPNLRGPYIYSHTTTNAMKLVQKLRDLAAFQKGDFSAQVINVDSGWPLPWYLRDIPHIGYQNHVPDTLDAKVIVVDAEMATAAQAKLGDKAYGGDIYGLRPGVNVWLKVEKNLWEAFTKANQAKSPPP